MSAGSSVWDAVSTPGDAVTYDADIHILPRTLSLLIRKRRCPLPYCSSVRLCKRGSSSIPYHFGGNFPPSPHTSPKTEKGKTIALLTSSYLCTTTTIITSTHYTTMPSIHWAGLGGMKFSSLHANCHDCQQGQQLNHVYHALAHAHSTL